MKISSVRNQQNFKGSNLSAVGKFVSKHPMEIAGLAGLGAIAQKVVMSGSEAVIGPAMDIGIGKAITKITDEKDGRTNDSSKKQATRTFSAAVGGTIVGVVVRAICMTAATIASSKAGGYIASTVADANNSYLKAENAKMWGKSIGGAVAIFVMMFTNFLIDAPLINKINKAVTDMNTKFAEKKKQNKTEEVK